MLAFITAYSPLDSEFYLKQYAKCAGAGVARQPTSRTVIVDAKDGLAQAYESVLPNLRGAVDGAVFLHADLELLDPKFSAKVLHAFQDPEVAIVGLVGASGFVDISWWEARRKVGQVHHGPDHNIQPGVYFPIRSGEVDAVDGCCVALSPWALENLHFDPVLAPRFHGWEVDLCVAARAAGKKVLVIDSEAKHWCKNGLGDARAWQEANNRFKRKWGSWLVRPRRIQ